MADTVGIIGGTGPLGQGLAARFALAGIKVTIGSRKPERAAAAAEEVASWLEGREAAEVSSAGNLDACDADIVILSVPYEALDAALEPLKDALVGRTVVSALNPLGFDEQGPYPIPVEDGAVAVTCEKRLPDSRVVAAFHSVSSRQLARLDEPIEEDVPVFGSDEDAIDEVSALIERVEGLRPVPAGPLRLAGPVEGLTAVIIAVNKRHKAHVGLRFARLER